MDNHDSNDKKIIESEVILIEQSLMASGFSEQNAFCLIGGLGKLFLPFLSDKFINTCKPPKGNALQGAIAIAKRVIFLIFFYFKLSYAKFDNIESKKNR